MKQQTERSESYVTSREAFVQSNSGGIAVMASFGIVAAILVCGALVDYARMTASKTALSAAVDAAALQVAASGSTNMTMLEALAEASIAQNYGSGDQGNVTNISVRSEDGAITVVAQAEVETTFVSITGIESVSIQADATVSTISVNRKDMEVALVTDMSGDGDLETIKTAARSFADLLVSKDHTDAVKRLALVPASERLYLGSRAAGCTRQHQVRQVHEPRLRMVPLHLQQSQHVSLAALRAHHEEGAGLRHRTRRRRRLY